MSKTKKLTAGVPVVDSSGAVTPVSISELAKQVGEQLGIQTATYLVKGTRWIRVALVKSTAAILLISNEYASTLSRGVTLSISGAYIASYARATLVSGFASLFDKIRFVSCPQGMTYLEIHSSIGETQHNRWTIKSISHGVDSATLELYQTLTPGEVPEGSTVKELTISDLMGGGKRFAFNALRGNAERRAA